MKLLILCDMFPPAFAPRMGYLCKYLKRTGWEPVVVTEQINENMYGFLTGYAEVVYINYYKATGGIGKKLEWLYVFLFDFFFNYKDRKMFKTASRIVSKGGFQGILCSTFRTFPLPAAMKTAKRFDLPFVADTRDIIEQHPGHEYISYSFRTFPWLDKQIIKLFRRKLLKGRNKALKAADCITTVSPWHVEVMKKYNPSVELIYNGYDPELFYPEQIITPTFCLTYTGRLVSLATRDPEPLFEAIARLKSERIISDATLRIQWYIDEKSKQLLYPLAERYKITEYMDYFDFVPADQLPGILNRSSILLQLANKAGEAGPKGIMSTKLFESFAVEKPMLCVRSDESFLEDNIRRARAGASARNAQEAYDFILFQYREWQKNGYTTVDIDHDVVDLYSRSKQAVQFMHIFEELVKKRQTR